jgi:predicted CXXCH cytochrome family protein
MFTFICAPRRGEHGPLTAVAALLPFLSAGVLLFSSVATAAEPAGNEEAQTCLACHGSPGTFTTFGDGSRLSVQVDGRQFAASVHGALACTSCHVDVDLNSHPSAKYATKLQFQLHASSSCRNCHDDRQLMANPQHQRVVARQNAPSCSSCHGSHGIKKSQARKDKESTTEYCLTCHAKPLTRTINGETISLTVGSDWLKESVHRQHECTDCHTAYSKEFHPAPKTFGSARELRRLASETCERCHLQQAVKQRDSIHRTLLQRGVQAAPSCSDCHGSHRIGPAARIETLDGVPCKACHRETFEAYKASVHGATVSSGKGGAPLCAGCHRAHDVKPAMVSRSPRDMCLGCHPAFESDHGQWLPNPGAHLQMVSCTACHVPLEFKRRIYLRLTDAETGKLLTDAEVRTYLQARNVNEKLIGPKDLWQLVQDLGAQRKVAVDVAVSMNDSRYAHHLAPKARAVRTCEECHSADSSFFQSASVAVARPDGREADLDLDPAVLRSVYGAILFKRFYVMSGTRLKAMDYVGAAIILGGIAVPAVHGSLRFLTRRLRRRKNDGGEGRGRS